MDLATLKSQIAASPLSTRSTYQQMYLYVSPGGAIDDAYAELLDASTSYREFFNRIVTDAEDRMSLLWAEAARLSHHDWLGYFTPDLSIEKIRMKTDGVPIQFGTGVMLAPTGSRDNIANLYVFNQGAFNAHAADFVTSIGGTFRVLDYEFCGIYGVYKSRGNVILETWEAEHEPQYKPDKNDTCAVPLKATA
ncbi:MAG: hypothetical protein SOI38_08920 [Eggerthellaceae bacterium]|jgi:hypothetical protein